MAGGMWTLLTVGSIIFFTRTGAITLQNRHILRYEPLHYSRDELHRRHIISTAGADLHLTIKAYGRSFRLRLQRDTSQFTEEFQVMQGRQLIKPDLSFIYTGEIIGIDQSHHILVLDSEVEGRPLDIVELLCKLSGFLKPSMGRADKNWPEHFYSRGQAGSSVYGAVINGTFQGTLDIPGDTTYTIERSNSLFDESPTFHSIIYSNRDIDWKRLGRSIDSEAADYLHPPTPHRSGSSDIFQRIELSPHNPWTRIKREAKNPLQKRICTLKLTADHVMWDYFMRRNNQIPDRARYEILYIFKSHVTRLNSIFGKTTFIANKGTSEEMVVFSGIQFEIRNVTILDGKYCYDVDGNWREEDLCARDANANILDVFRNIEKKESDEHGDVDFDYPTEYDMNETTHDDDKESHGHIDSFQSEEAEVCLSYLFTARVLYVPGIKLNDPAQPLIGIARAAEQNIMAGICMRGGNIGLVTFVHINETYLPPPVTQLVFTHEVGHSFGAQVEDITVKFGLRQLIKNPTNFTEHASSIIDLIFHDNEEKCAKYFPANERPADGHYLMYSITQQGRELNNAIFSNCSRHIIGQILSDGHHTGCFQESKVPFCGNNVVEAGEECDCGMAGVCEDHCCHARGDNPNKTMLDCTLRQGAVCSGDNYEASCPAPTPAQVREDNFLCNNNGRVCDKGECTGSICRLIRWRECQTVNDAGKLSKTEREELCYVACQQKKTTECISTSNAAKVKQYPKFDGLLKTVSQRADQDGFPVQLPVGTPCNNEHGYCDVFRRCRGMNTDTALVRLKNCLTSRNCRWNFLHSYWWAVSLITIAGIIVMTVIVFFCSVHTMSDNPSHEEKNPSMQWRDTIGNPRKSFGISRTKLRRSFSRHISKYDGEMEPTDPGDEVVNIELLPHIDS